MVMPVFPTPHWLLLLSLAALSEWSTPRNRVTMAKRLLKPDELYWMFNSRPKAHDKNVLSE